MARGTLFEYAVLFHGKPKKDAEGNDITDPSKIITHPATVLATSEKVVAARAARSIPAEFESQLEQVEIIVRPF